jgi:hypothetical protein
VIAREQLSLFHTVSLAPPTEELQTYCRDCAANVVETGEYYMVHDHVWPVEKYGGVLCIGCLEARLGRTLAREDFTDVPLNRPLGSSARMRARLRAATPDPSAARWRLHRFPDDEGRASAALTNSPTNENPGLPSPERGTTTCPAST